MTTVFVNAVSIREGGSLVLLRELQAEMVALRPDWRWHVCTNDVARAKLPDFARTVFHVVPEPEFAGWRVRWWYESSLPRLLRDSGADVLFSQTNYLPWYQPCPSLLLVQHAGHFSADFKALTEAELDNPVARLMWRMKTRWVLSSVRRAAAVTVQTAALARPLVAATGVEPARVTVIPHGSGLVRSPVLARMAPEPGLELRVGYISIYGVQKNFGVLFAAAARLRQQGVRLRLVLTLDERKPQGQAVLALARRLGVPDLVENHGELDPAAIVRLYSGLHLFVFASLCESFGFPQVEAMASGLPLLIAGTESNREVAGPAGLVFAPHDAAALADLIARVAGDPDLYRDCVDRSLQRAAEFAWEKSATATITLLEHTIAHGKAAATARRQEGAG